MHIRTATARDADFLARMLLEAFNWTGEHRFTADEMMRDPKVAHYVTGWPRQGDFGVIAVGGSGAPAGAAWARVFPADDPGYGYAAPGVPELSLAVAPEHRGRGVGSMLLDALIRQAADAGVDRLSLSVEDGNPAVRLYLSRGFATVGRNGGSDTMVLRVDAAALREPPRRA